MEYPEIYEIMYVDKSSNELKSFDKTHDKEIALHTKQALINQGHKQVHIQHTFKEGGKITDSVNIGYRPLFLETPIVYGRKIEISMPNGEKRQAQFAIVNADNILASHNEHSFVTTIGYPTINGENINDRNYADDKNAQAKVIEVAQNLDPNILVSTSRTPSGTPIITKDGIVVSGNNRTMSIKRAITDFPKEYRDYCNFLVEEVFAFGIKKVDVSAGSKSYEYKYTFTGINSETKTFDHPILVRIDYDFPEYNTTELSKYNKETKKSERPIDKAIKIGKMLNENEGCKNMIAELVGEYETFSQFYASYSDQVKLRDMLISCNIITKNELAAYFDERGFTENGKDLIENLLAGMILSKDALIAGSMAGGRQFKTIVITSLPVLAKNASLAENSLIDLLNKAFLLEKKIHDSGLDFKDYIVQGNMFDEAPEKNVLIMNRLLAAGRNKFKSSIDAYNQSAIDNQNESLFGDKPSFQEMYDTYITSKIDTQDLALINKNANSTITMEPNTSQEFDQAIMDKIDPHDDWKGNLIKERHVLSQIYNELKGSEAEKEKEVVRLFLLYAAKFPGKISETNLEQLGLKQPEQKMDYDNMPLDDLIALKKKKYSNMDIESPKSDDEKALEKAIAAKLSIMNSAVMEKRNAEKQQKQSELLSNIEGSELYKKLKKDFMFILSLQKSKNEKGTTEGWDINLFKSSFLNKIKKEAYSSNNAVIQKVLLDLKRIQAEQLTKPAFTNNHQIWQYLEEQPTIVETKEATKQTMPETTPTAPILPMEFSYTGPATMYLASEFMGNINKIDVTDIKIKAKKYAQYEKALSVTFIPKGKRSPGGTTLTYSPYILVLKGYNTPVPQSSMKPIAPGVEQSIYTSFDDRWQADFDKVVDDYIAEHPDSVLFDARAKKYGKNTSDSFEFADKAAELPKAAEPEVEKWVPIEKFKVWIKEANPKAWYSSMVGKQVEVYKGISTPEQYYQYGDGKFILISDTTTDPIEDFFNNPMELVAAGEAKQTNTLNLLVNDNWYAQNPDKVLGEPYKTSGRFGEVTKYRGKIDSVNRIDAPLNFMQINAAENPTISTENETVNQLLQDPQAQQNIEISLEGTRKETIIREIKKHTKAVTRIVASNPVLDADMVTFEQVFAQNNPEISKDELQVFVWYKEAIGERLSNKWYQLSGWQMGASPLTDWINNGLVFHFRGSLIPAYLYLSGNIWEKKSALENDKSTIIELYGNQVFENQKLVLDNVFKISYDKRLTLTNANFDNRLKLLPISKFANTFTIETLVDGKEFKMKSQPAGGKQPGRPDFLYVGHMSDWKKTKFTQLSLTEAFQYWLVNYRGEYQIKKDTNYAEIIKIYVQQGQRPSLGKDGTPVDKKEAEAIWQRKLNITKEEGDRLFSIFLAEWLNVEDIVKIETTWNERFNGYLPVNYNKIPVAFAHAKEYRNSVVDIRPEKREAVTFLMNEGSGCLAYDVGVGKTWSALFAIKQFMDAGYCKRPFIVVPNQVYKQFLAEGKGLFPDVKFNDLYNLSKDYLSELKDADGNIEMLPENSISVLTYEGFEQIGFSENTANQIVAEMYDILDQNPDKAVDYSSKSGQKREASFYERLQTLIGRGLRGTLINIEDLGFDFACYDEAHKMKKLFVGVKGEMKSNGEDREKNPYQIQAGGAPSSIALKGFMISQYILKNNNNRNVLTLTATPFTNSPLEIFSVLTFIAYGKLRESGLNNLKSFFDTYVHATNELVINAKLRPERKQVVLGFNNLQSLQQLISRFVNYKTGEMVRVPRPNKYVLPYKSKLIDGELIQLSESERVDTILPLSAQQRALMDDIKAYAESKIELSAICGTSHLSDKKTADDSDDEDMVDATAGVELDESTLNDDEKAGVRTLRAMSYARNLALSPYLYECAGLGKPSYIDYIETSPKLQYVIECIRSVKKYHEKNNTPVSGQVIYMDRGVEYFGLIKEYLIKEVGYKEHEVGIIKSQMPGGKDAKEKVKMAFLGEAYDAKSGELYDIPDSERMKIVIGSSTIKEGINLQKHSTVLYNCFVDWNPTDVKQLEGRIWRQGNLYNSVRIATPLMEDSMDIFIFQKLSEKTARIAEIWDSNGESNTFNLQEFNPSEIKSALISDPMVLAELQLIEDKEKIDDDIRGLKNEQSNIDKIIEAKQTFEAYFNDFDKYVDEYRPKKEGETRSFATLLGLANGVVKTQLDAEGKKMEYTYNRSNKEGVVYSDKSPAGKPYYQDKLVLANRTLLKAEKEYLKPKGLTIEKLPLYKDSLNDRIKELDESKAKITSEENIKLRADYIAAERAANKVESVGAIGRAKEFERLNYLLDDKVKKSKKQEPIAMACPPLDEKGERRIDKEAIEHLTVCINAQPQTKEQNVDKDGEYTAERKKLHAKIREAFKQNATCIKQDKPIAILTGGAPGSGKSHFLKNYAPYLLSKNIFHIDADEVRAQLPEYKGWNASATHHETKDIVDELIDDIGGKCKFDTIYDGTMNKAKKYYELIDKLKSVGYEVFIIYIDVPREVSEMRVLDRYKRKGRFVPMDVVQEVFDAGHTAFDQIKKMVNGWILVDGMSGQVMEHGGEKIPQNRDYAKLTDTINFKKEQKLTDDNRTRKVKIAKAKAAAQSQRIRILELDKMEQGGSVNDYKYNYRMLDRLRADNDYYLGNEGKSKHVKHLWAGNVEGQIAEMKKLWNQLPDNKKPEWLSMEDILEYERKMK
jgi:predicted ABC-type ATPase